MFPYFTITIHYEMCYNGMYCFDKEILKGVYQ